MRTGVTAILPRGKDAPLDPVFAGWFTQNGNGEMTGTTWVEESGLLYGPVMITNTHSVGVVRDAVIAWALARYHVDLADDRWSLPVVAETWDGWLNDINGFHVKAPSMPSRRSIGARSGPVTEGNVGGGTGMICYEFKGGTGTASRRGRRMHRVTTRSACWCRRTSAAASSSRSPACPSARRSPEQPAYDERRRDAESHRLGLDHRRHGHRCAAAAAPAEAHRAPRRDGHRAHRRHGQQRLRRHLHRVLHGEFRRWSGRRACPA